MQVDPIKPTLNAPGIKLLKLIYDVPLSNFAFKFSLRHYTLGHDSLACARGGAVQVYPIKPTLKAPETKRLKLNYDVTLSKFAFKFNSRRYTEVKAGKADQAVPAVTALNLENMFAASATGRAVQVDPIKPNVESDYGIRA